MKQNKIEVKFSKEKPAIFKKCHEAFGVEWGNGLIITYGDTVHCDRDIPMDLWAHELTHVTQQTTMGVKKWWNEYFKSPEFRIRQESEAYRNQVNYLKKNVKDRNQLFRAIVEIRKTLSGPMYGNAISYEDTKFLM
jgi:hypothetical protein